MLQIKKKEQNEKSISNRTKHTSGIRNYSM